MLWPEHELLRRVECEQGEVEVQAPRMASEQYGPTVVRQLEPPGFLALHYGVRTPISVVLAHLAFGAILGGFYSFN